MTAATWMGMAGERSRPFRYGRDLLRELVVRDIKVRYKRSWIGLGWSLLNPLVQLAVFNVFFTFLMPLQVPDYTSFLFTGIVVWNWFQVSLYSATGVIVDNVSLLKQPGFPAAVLPVASITANLVHFLLALPILLIAVLAGGHHLTLALMALPIVIGVQFSLTLGLSYILAALQVPYRDTQYMLGIALTMGFYFTPVFYDAKTIPPVYQAVYRLNPVVCLLDSYRAIFIHGRFPDFGGLLLILLVGVGLSLLGLTYFRQASYRFVEEI
jgi:lipopolysaccharide transport system permease protein